MLCDCGSTLQGGVKFCSQCGKKVLAPASEDVQTIPCPNTVEDGRRTPVCGTMIDSSNRFCHECAWRISSKAFLPGAAMCDGEKSNGEPCDNIVTPNIKFCSECGKPPKNHPSQTKTSASAVVEKTFSTKPEKDLIGGTINQDVQENKTSDDHTSEDMEFEVVSVSSTEEETPVKRSHSYDEAINLENSSDFCNGQLANIAKEQDSSTSIQDSKPQQQGDFQEKGILDSMEIVDLPSGGSVEHVQLNSLGEEGEHGNTTNEKTDNLENLPENRMDTTNDNTGTGNVESTPKMDISQGGKISILYETGSESSNKGTLSAENVEKPQATPSQIEGAEDEVRDSGTLSTENTLYEPSWSQEGGQEQLVINALKTLDVRKRKSPDRDIPEAGKKPHLSETQSDRDDNGNKQDHSEEGTGGKENKNMDDSGDDDDDDDEEEDDDSDDDGNKKDEQENGNNDEENESIDKRGKKKNKKHSAQKKKKKVEYQRKKGQLVPKPSDSKKGEIKTGSSKKPEREIAAVQKSSSDVSKSADKNGKTEKNEQLKSQALQKDEKKNTEKESTQPTSAATGDKANNTSSHQPGRVQIPEVFLEGNGKDVGGSNKGPNDPSISNKENKPQSYAEVTASNRPMTRSMTKTVELHFHALVSKKLVRDTYADSILVSFRDTFSGRWKDLHHKLYPKELVANFIYYEGAVHIPKSVANQNFYYNYCVLPNGLSEWQYWEFFYDQKENTTALRELVITGDAETFHRFDGVVVGEPDENKYYRFILGYFLTEKYEEDLDFDMVFALKYFFPKWKGFMLGNDNMSCHTCKEALDCIDSIHQSFWSNYGKRLKRWRQDFMKFKRHIGMAFWEMLLPKVEEFAKQKETDIVSAMSILYIIDRFSLDVKPSAYTPLFRALVQVNVDYKEVISNFDEKMIKQCIDRLVDKYKDTDNPVWLCCLPLHHLVTKKIQKPFDKLQLAKKHAAEVPRWWGIDGIEGAFNTVKWKKWDAKAMLECLSPLFQMDYLLPRSFVAALEFEQLKDVVPTELIPVEVTLAALYYFSKQYKVKTHKNEVVTVCFDTVSKQMKKVYNEENVEVTEDMLNHAWISYHIAGDLFDQIVQNYNYENGLCVRTFSLFMMAIALYDFLFEKRGSIEGQNTQHKNEHSHLTVLHKQRDAYITWLKSQSQYTQAKKYLQAWSFIFKIPLKEGTVKTSVLSEVKRALKQDLTIRSISADDLFGIYCSDDEYPAEVLEVLAEIALKVIENGCSLNDTILSSKGVDRYGLILSKHFETAWKKKNTEGKQSFLQFTLSWPSFFHFLNMFYLQDKKSKLLSKDSGGLLTKAAQEVWTAYEDLLSGQITVENFRLVQKNKDNFFKIIKIVIERDKKDVVFNETCTTQLINIRDKEISHFERILCDVRIFTDMCHHFEVDTLAFDEALSTFRDLTRHKIGSLCKPESLSKVEDVEAYMPVICAFTVEDEILDIVPQLYDCSKGLLFMKLWERRGKRCVDDKGGVPLAANEVISQVWEPVYENLLAIAKRIRDGTMLFSEFQKHFGSMPDEHLIKELGHLSAGGDKEWIEKRMEQIQQHRMVKQCVNGAHVIMNVVETYGLEGDFHQMDLIVEMARGKDIAMNKLDKDLIKATVSLKGMTEKQVECLKVFMDCKPLVEWVRESMKNLQELKVFVDLASISAGEGAMEVDRVKCLHAATTGYAPLIFNLDKACGSKIFLEKCELVWKELDSDPNLPKKLIDTKRQLEWLNSVKSAQGSVEVTSMRQAEAINSVGIYLVGKVDPSMTIDKPSLEDVLQLHVQEDTEGSRLRKKYKHKELQELQSKLMLVAGKAEMGKDDVDRFTIVFDAIVRLCNVYIKLVSSGCVLFSNWQAKFLCDPDRKVCAFIKFGSGNGCTQLKGGRNEGDDVSTIIPRLAKFMEVCLEEWLKYIDHKRDEYQHLNFFTIDQMVILQKELVLMGGEVEPSDLIYPLLSIVKHDCTKMDLIGALKKAKGDVSQKEAEQEVEMEDNEKEEEEEDVDPNEEDNTRAIAVAKFIAEIVNSGYSDKLAREALKSGLDPENIEEDLSVFDTCSKMDLTHIFGQRIEIFMGFFSRGLM